MTERVFPPSYSPSGVLKHEGMSLRDHFAGLAMQGFFATFKHYPYKGEIDKVAVIAYEAADAMLKQRSLTND